MTTLYRSVLIETAEQAEALPDNTMVIHPQEWPLMFVNGKLYTESETVTVEEIVEQGGYSALVPIEAEEETRIESDLPGCETEQDFRDYLDGKRDRLMRRFNTPWEEA